MPAVQADDNQPITSDWLSTWATKSQYCWLVPDSDMLIAPQRDPSKRTLWVILRAEEDGDETELFTATDRYDVREALESIGVESDGVELADFR